MKQASGKDVVSLEETLAYIKYLNRERPFEQEELQIPTRDYEQLQAVPRTATPVQKPPRKARIQQGENQDLTKKINKNRAIKRIIEGAFQILQEFDNYEEEEAEGGDKSSEIQFNIYLKQYNRVLELIHSREKERLSREEAMAEQREELLQNIYEYTVVEDFREVLLVAVLKDKISKNNIEIMINKLNEALVVLSPEGLRIHDSPNSPPRKILLQEIENVDYHTQPHVFLVLTVQKDKERFNIYMKFDSEKNQEKWDRALYCCYIGRKMKAQEKFFLAEYPEEDVIKKEKEENKKQQDFHYEAAARKRDPLTRVMAERQGVSISSHSPEESQEKKSGSRSHSRMVSRSQKFNKTVSQKEDTIAQATAAKEEKELISDLAHKGTTNKSQYTLENSSPLSPQKKDSRINRIKTDFIQVSRAQEERQAQPMTPHRVHDLNQQMMNRQHDDLYLKEAESYKQQPMEPVQELPQDIRRIHELERKYARGMVVEKEKFFFNKQKVVFLRENEEQKGEKQQRDVASEYLAMRGREIEYWDFEAGSGEKSERKLIPMTTVKRIQMREGRLLSIVHGSEKEIVFGGALPLLNDFIEWMRLILAVYERNSLPPNNPKPIADSG